MNLPWYALTPGRALKAPPLRQSMDARVTPTINSRRDGLILPVYESLRYKLNKTHSSLRSAMLLGSSFALAQSVLCHMSLVVSPVFWTAFTRLYLWVMSASSFILLSCDEQTRSLHESSVQPEHGPCQLAGDRQRLSRHLPLLEWPPGHSSEGKGEPNLRQARCDSSCSPR